MQFIKKHSKGLILLACLLLIALVFGMATFTFARYTSSTNSTNQATVAKWGYVVTVNADNMFGTKYGETTNNLVKVSSTGQSIVSSTSAKIIAPGATGSLVITLNGSAEVLAELKFTVNSVTDVSITNDDTSTAYNPIKWTLNDGSADLFTGVATADLSTKFATLGETIDANTTLTNKTYTLTWEWALDSGNDAADTALGQAAAAGGSAPTGWSNANTTLALDVTVELRQTQE